jgi:hypothetical protein
MIKLMNKSTRVGLASVCTVTVLAAITFLLHAEASAGPQIYRNNVLTAQHITVPGTHVAVIPPGGAKPSAEFNGFEIAARNIRFVIMERSTPYSDVAGTLTPEGLEADGVKASDISDVNLNGKPAKIILGKSSESGEENGVVLFVIGNERMTIYLWGYYPATDKSAVNLLRNSMLSAIIEPKQKEKAIPSYTLSTVGTNFKLVDEVAGTRHFALDSASYQGNAGDAVYSSSSFSQGVPQEERAEFAEKAVEKYLSQYKYKIESKRDVNFGGLPGIEVVVDLEGATRIDRTASGGTVRRPIPAKGYVAVLFDPSSDTIYSFNGIAVRNAENFLSQFVRITSSFAKPKS